MEHDEAFITAIEEIIQHGYFFTGGLNIVKYNPNQDSFNNVDEADFIKEFNGYYLSQFDNYNNTQAFTIDDITKELPRYEDIKSKFYSYKRYKKASSERVVFNKLEQDLKPYLEKNENMKDELIFKTGSKKDILYLINNDIFTDGTKNRNGMLNIYKYDHENKKFILATSENIFDLININPDNENPNYWLDTVPKMVYIDKYTGEEKQIVHLTDIIFRFNKYYETEAILKDSEPGFKMIVELVNSFKV